MCTRSIVEKLLVNLHSLDYIGTPENNCSLLLRALLLRYSSVGYMKWSTIMPVVFCMPVCTKDAFFLGPVLSLSSKRIQRSAVVALSSTNIRSADVSVLVVCSFTLLTTSFLVTLHAQPLSSLFGVMRFNLLFY